MLVHSFLPRLFISRSPAATALLFIQHHSLIIIPYLLNPTTKIIMKYCLIKNIYYKMT
jgi:hypothetical protein